MGNKGKVIRMTVLGALILGAILNSSLTSCKKEAGTENGLVSKAGLPAIDASAPMSTETATFALG